MLGNTQSILTLLTAVSRTQTSMSILTLNDVIVEFLSPLCCVIAELLTLNF